MIGTRPISTFQFREPLIYKNYSISCLEVPAPKNGSYYESGLEHAEFVIGNIELDDFIKQYPNVEFDLRAKEKKINPDISIKLKTG